MSKEDMQDLRASMRKIKVRKRSMRQRSFVALVKDQDESFGKDQIEQAFVMIDTDKSGKIDKNEFENWFKNYSKHDAEQEMQDMANNAESVLKVNEIMNVRASTAVLAAWNACVDVLPTGDHHHQRGCCDEAYQVARHRYGYLFIV